MFRQNSTDFISVKRFSLDPIVDSFSLPSSKKTKSHNPILFTLPRPYQNPEARFNALVAIAEIALIELRQGKCEGDLKAFRKRLYDTSRIKQAPAQAKHPSENTASLSRQIQDSGNRQVPTVYRAPPQMFEAGIIRPILKSYPMQITQSFFPNQRTDIHS